MFLKIKLEKGWHYIPFEEGTIISKKEIALSAQAVTIHKAEGKKLTHDSLVTLLGLNEVFKTNVRITDVFLDSAKLHKAVDDDEDYPLNVGFLKTPKKENQQVTVVVWDYMSFLCNDRGDTVERY